MVEENIGAGIALDQSMDFGVSSEGDIRSVRGAEELNKDIAFQLKLILVDLKGQPLTPDTKGQIKSDTINTLLSDNRVVRVNRAGIEIRDTGRDSIRIIADYQSTAGPQELVFEL